MFKSATINIMPAMNEVSPTAGQIGISVKMMTATATKMVNITRKQAFYKTMSRTRGPVRLEEFEGICINIEEFMRETIHKQ